MKKFLAIPILLLFAFAQFGHFFVYQYKQEKARQEVKKILFASLPEAALYSFELPAAEKNIIWKEKGKEFYLNGDLFDVVKIKKMNGKSYIYCINDRKEKEVLAGFAKLAGAQSEHNGKSGKNTVKFQLPDFIIRALIKLPVFNFSRHLTYFSFDTALASVISPIQAPPPRI